MCLYSLLFQRLMSAARVLTDQSVVRTCYVFEQQSADPLSCYALYWSAQAEIMPVERLLYWMPSQMRSLCNNNMFLFL